MDPHRRNELRSIELHRLVAGKVTETLRAKIINELPRWRLHPEYEQRWRELLALPLPELRSKLVEDSEEMRALRQSSPFAGLVDQDARLAILYPDLFDRDPEIQDGRPIIRGTRIAVATVWARLEAGETIDGLCRDHPGVERSTFEMIALPLLGLRSAPPEKR
jgi:uncharacterized protein (DUF433 family)